MRTTIFAVAIAGLLVITGCRPHRTEEEKWSKGSEYAVEKLSKELLLDKKQEQEISRIAQEIIGRHADFKKLTEGVTTDIAGLLRSSVLDTASANAMFADREARLKELRRFMVGKMSEVHAVLTPEQRTKAAERLEKMQHNR